MVGPQICAAGGGGGGNPPDVPENQEVGVSGSADRMVISGRLAKGSQTEASHPHSGTCISLSRERFGSALPPVSVPVSLSLSGRLSWGGGPRRRFKKVKQNTHFSLFYIAKWTNQTFSDWNKHSLLLIAALMDERGPWLEEEVKKNMSPISQRQQVCHLSPISLFSPFALPVSVKSTSNTL